VALTLAEAQRLRAAYLAALEAIATGQSYTIGSRTLTRADLVEVKKSFNEYDAAVTALQAGRAPGGVRAVRVVPRDL